MEYTEFKDLLKVYRKQGYNEEDLQRLWVVLSDEKKEEQVKAYLLNELNEFEVNKTEEENVNFNRIFKNIQTKVSANNKNVLQLNQPTTLYKKLYPFLRAAAVLIFVFVIGGVFSYFFFQKSGSPANAYTEIKAPYGAKSEVVLPDGSCVWINAGSSIKYNSDFNKESRTILLEGEAYFKVAKNKKIPFIVNTDGIDIVAVGTEFNVKAYTDEDFIETTLVEGKVTIRGDREHKNKAVEQVSLEPKQTAVYLRDNKQVKVANVTKDKTILDEKIQPGKGTVYVTKKVDPIPIIAWKDSKLIIKGEELSSLAVKLERKYNVNILFDSKNIKKYRFCGTLEDETLTQVLDVIKLTSPIDYELNGKEVRIFENLSLMQKFNNHLNRK